jgi:ferredoxin-NADP reductase
MHQGELVFIEGPKGEFILPQTAHQPICFIAEGIGITPFISMIRYVVHNNLDHKITLFYYNNSQKTEAYKDELRTYKSKIALKEVYGHLTNETLQITGNETALWFIAGPVDMVDSAKNILRMNTIDERNIKTEKITGYE